jgi:hypothetical protein
MYLGKSDLFIVLAYSGRQWDNHSGSGSIKLFGQSNFLVSQTFWSVKLFGQSNFLVSQTF